MSMSVKASKAGDQKKAIQLLTATLILGLGFGASQFMGWSQLIDKGSFSSSHIDNLNGVYGEDYTITYQGQELIYEDGEYYTPNDELREKPLLDEIAIYSNSAASYMYLLSAVHVLHVLGGFLFLISLLISATTGKTRVLNTTRLKLGAIYWHFVDGLWVYLLLFLLLIH